MDLWLLHLNNQTFASPWLDPVMIGLTEYAFRLLPGIGIIYLLRRQYRLGWALFATFALALLLTFVFYYLGLRLRPYGVRLILPQPDYPSFPSGHAATSFAVATLLALTYRQRWVQELALISAGLIAYSRIYLGHHYPSDVLAGVVLGMSVGAFSYGVALAPGDRLQRWRWLLWPQVAVVFLVTQMAYLDILPKHLLAWPFADKVLHFFLFGLVVFWLNLWLHDKQVRIGTWVTAPVAVVLPFALALAEEVLQLFSPLRTLDFTDLASDLLGMICFWWLSQRVLAAHRSKSASNQ
jgi:undecaprenyl-diphosphatase